MNESPKSISDILEHPNFRKRSEEEKNLVRHAYALAEIAHEGQKRESGGPYIQHPLAVGLMLTEIDMDTDTIAAGLLHDVVEDAPIELEELEADFGPDIANLVDGVTKLEQIEQEQIEQEQIDDRYNKKRQSNIDQGLESLRKMFIAMVEDIRVVIIKLADRLHNMRTLNPLPEQRKKAFARETQEIFAPLASRLGVWQWKWELEDLSFRYLDEKNYEYIKGAISERRQERSASIERHIEIIKRKLSEEGIEAEIKGRPKHIYSIHRKMERKEVDFEQVYDVRGIRVITKNISDCYRILGILHGLWKPIPGEFDDYIAAPKDNNYRSLHTAVLAEDGKTLEVQLRTEDMHRIAERGVAAHWRYKEGIDPDSSFDDKLAWIRVLMEWRQEITDASEFVDAMKNDIFQDRVYTITPRGDIIDLPTGSTPIDFAYHIHTEVGNRCRGAKVNDKWVGLNYELEIGDRVEIITGKKSSPSRDWLNPNLGYIKTTRARNKIRQWFRHQDREKNIAQGREMVERELKTLGMDHLGHKTVAGLFDDYDNLDDFYSAVGFGDISNQQLAGKIAEKTSQVEEKLPSAAAPLPPPQPVESIQVMGTGNLLTKLARCCNPIPNEEIIGFVTRGRGVTIHRRDCPNILRIKGKAKERLVEVSWGAKPEVFPVAVCVEAYDRPGLLHEIAGVITNEKINISSVSVNRNNKNITTLYLTLEVQDIQQLARVLDKVKRLSNVTDAHRHTG